MADLYFRGGPNDGLAPTLAADDDHEYLWFQNGATGKTERYRRTSETMEINGSSRTVFEYAPE
ncbi:hypothetical protein [Streptomyces sp. GESEQ-35]|uniref:hypothetical protein n=1 Tax=Streptomyces sp. GESEQ-35 TaxID=2812657 RepID=UPI001B335DD5|nr:hypothetical protein [Streptomyces sp. GESEQ-35]